MAFNFNWSPLTADATFYTRAQDLLTTALNKSPKPPIIVDDILVNELNLGHVPPELEILEIGDLAEDRFRGIFKMSYHGDAFLTLKTRVQANPLNTYLLTRPSFASPRPLAAQTGLTIPIQITLSDIKLSAFIILVFSRQKGLTLVFRNDPLESLKVSSTFDSIPFVANYLQREIEGQLRTLLMDELPAIIHRLSLQMFVPEYMEPKQDNATAKETAKDEPAADPFASLPEDPVDSTGNPLNAAEVASLSLDSSIETQSLFSQKNLLRLATLENSHRTLSLFTPSIRDVVFRAWATPLERGEIPGHQTSAPTPSLSRSHSYTGSLSTTYTFDSGPQIRPSLQSYASTGHIMTLGAGRSSTTHSHAKRKRKKRVVDLRRQPTDRSDAEVAVDDGSTVTDSASVTESTGSAPSALPGSSGATSEGVHRLVGDPFSLPISPSPRDERLQLAAALGVDGVKRAPPETEQPLQNILQDDLDRTIRRKQPPRTLALPETADVDATPRASMYLPERRESILEKSRSNEDPTEKPTSASVSGSGSALPGIFQFITDPKNGDSIAEKAWMMKMANEIARRYEEERVKGSFELKSRRDGDSGGGESGEGPPPAYAPS